MMKGQKLKERIVSMVLSIGVLFSSVIGSIPVMPLVLVGADSFVVSEKVLSEDDFAQLCNQLGFDLGNPNLIVSSTIREGTLEESNISSMASLVESQWYKEDIVIHIVTSHSDGAQLTLNGTPVAIASKLALIREGTQSMPGGSSPIEPVIMGMTEIDIYSVNLSADTLSGGSNDFSFEAYSNEESETTRFTIKHYTPVSIETTSYPSGAVLKDSKVCVGKDVSYKVNITGDYQYVTIKGSTYRYSLDGVTIPVNQDGTYKAEGKCINGEGFSFDLFEGNEVVVNTVSPKVNCKVDGEPLRDTWYTVADTVSFEVSPVREDFPISSQSVTVNGKDISLKDDSIAVSALPKADNGVYTFVYRVSDVVGNSAELTFVFKLDADVPVCDPSKLGGVHTIGGKTYVDNELVFNSDALYDAKSGVNKVEYKVGDEDYHEVSLPHKVTNLDGTYKVTDNAGNSAEFVVATICNGYIFDTDTPVVTAEYTDADYKSNGKLFFKTAPTAKYSVVETNILSVQYFVNDTEVSVSLTGENTLELDLSSVNACSSDGEYTVKLVITDTCNKKGEATYTFTKDSTPPTVEGLSIEGFVKYYEDRQEYVIGDPVQLIGTATDVGSGVKSVALLKDGEEVNPKQITEGGNFTIKLVDNLDNEVTVNIGAVLGNAKVAKVVRDMNFPLTTFEVAPTSYTDSLGRLWYKEKPAVSYKIVDADITRYTVSVNGVEVANVEVNKSTATKDTAGNIVIENVLDLSQQNGLTIDIEIKAYDEIQHTSTNRLLIGVDSIAPDVSGISAEIVGNSFKDNSTLFINGSIRVSGLVKDEQSGIASIDLMDDSAVVESFQTSQISYNITKSGKYVLVVTDNIGNTSELVIASVWDCTEVILDREPPSVKRVDDTAEPVPGWHKVTPILRYAIDDENLESAIAYINGREEARITYPGVLEIVTSGYKNQHVEVKVVAKDLVSNETSEIYSYTHDDEPPTDISARGGAPVNQKGGTAFYNSAFSVDLDAVDKGIGLDGFKFDGRNSNSTITVSSAGRYMISAYDKLDNVSNEVGLGELLGWSGNNVVFDNELPIISATLPSPSVTYREGWYDRDITFSVSLRDNVGLDNVRVLINGVELTSETYPSLDVLNESIQVDTSKATPNQDGSYQIEVVLEDNAKLVGRWSETIYIDKTAPSIRDFLISGEVKITGKTIDGSADEYGIFFDGNGAIQVNVEDTGISSGIHSIWYKFDNSEWVEKVTGGDTSITVSVPEDYKGTFKAYVVDNVGLKSEENMPDGIVSESSNTHINSSLVDISLETTGHYDANNLPLYNAETKAEAKVSCEWSGISKLEWGINDETLGTITDFTDNSTWDKNLPLTFDTSLDLNLNENAQRLWVKVTDNVDRISENEKFFSIDMDTPVVSLEFKQNNTSTYYNDVRSAVVTIEERNFDSSLIQVEGSVDSIGAWVQEGDIWSSVLTFASDGVYGFSISCTDRAGNVGNTVTSGSFTVDRTAPELDVSYSNNDVRHTMFYSSKQVVTIKVTERNFSSDRIRISGAEISGWTSNGDVHITEAVFEDDGAYSIVISGTDLAGNVLPEYSSGTFIIDKEVPLVQVGGASKGVSYKDNVSLAISISDTYLDESNTKVTLKGKLHDEIVLSGYRGDGEGLLYQYDDFKKIESTDDIYTLTITTMDMAGNIYSEDIVFSVNRFGSKYVVANEDLLGGYTNAPEDVIITELNVDRLDTSKAKVIITRDGKTLDTKESAFSVTEEDFHGKFMCTYTIYSTIFDVDGKYLIQVFSSSEVGDDYTSANEEYSFMVDTTPPEILLSGIETNGTYKDNNRVVAIDVRDFSGVQTVQVYRNGVEVPVLFDNELYTCNIGEAQGRQDLLVTVTDNAGNSSNFEVSNFLITSNVFSFLWSQAWFKIVLGGMVTVAGGLAGVLIRGRVKQRRREKAMADVAANYKSSTLNPTSSSQGSTSTGVGSSGQAVENVGTNDGRTEMMTDEATSVINSGEEATSLMDSGDSATSLMDDDSATGMLDSDDSKTDILDGNND